MVCAFAIANLNYFRPHKNKLLFWLSQMSFAITLSKYVTALVLSVAEYDMAADADGGADAAAHQRVESIGVMLITLDVTFILSSMATVIASVWILRRKLRDAEGSSTAAAQYPRLRFGVTRRPNAYMFPERTEPLVSGTDSLQLCVCHTEDERPDRHGQRPQVSEVAREFALGHPGLERGLGGLRLEAER